MSLEMRALGAGEIFDRAVTIYVRRFSLFAVIAAFVTVPVSIAQYLLVPEHGASAGLQLSPAIYAAVGIAFFFTPFVYVAVAAAIGAFYAGEPCGWREAYVAAFRHAGSIVLALLAEAVILLSAAFAGALVLGFLLGFSSALLRAFFPVGVVLAGFTAVCAIAYIAALMLCYLAIALAFTAIGMEGIPFGTALRRSFAQVFNRREAGKAIVVCFAFAAVELALFVLSALAVELTAHQALLQIALQSLLSLLTTGFIGVLLAVYYFDVRVRNEAPVPQPAAADGPRAARSTLIHDDEYAAIDAFIAQRNRLSAATRAETATRLAAQVRPRVSYDLQSLSDEDLLTALSTW